MKKHLRIVLSLVIVAMMAGPALAETFATLPEGIAYPEGIAINPSSGDIFVSTFSFEGNNTLLRYDKQGNLLAQIDFSTTPLLGLAFNPADNKVYICNTGDLVGDTLGSRIQRVKAKFNANTKVEEVITIPHLDRIPESDPPILLYRTVDNPDGSVDTIAFGKGAAAPNGMVFDSAGNLYVSDSFQGAIFKIEDAANAKTPEIKTIAHDSLFATAGFPPFGANGLAIDEESNILYIANTGDDRVLSFDMTEGKIAIFAESINGADGLAMDDDGYLWVAANQADALKKLNEDGRVIDSIGSFEDIDKDGAPQGLLFPASLVITGKSIYVTNLALPLTSAERDELEEDVTLYTVSKLIYKE